MKKIFVLLIIFILIITAVSCGDKKDGNKTDGTAGTDAGAAETLPALLDDDDAIPYADVKIVRADKSAQYETDGAVEIRKAILAKGEKVDLITDWTSASGIEIIVGNTARAAAPALKIDEYQIKRDEKGIFIFVGSGKEMSNAVTYFIENMLGEKGVLIPENYNYVKKSAATVSAFSFSGENVASAIFYGGKYGSSYATALVKLITEKVQIKSSISDSEKSANILFVTEDSEISADEWGLVCRDGKLYIVGADDIKTKRAYDFFVSALNSEKELVYDGVVHKEVYDSESGFETGLVIYPEFPEQVRRIYDYDVSVTMDGRTEKLPVYNHTDAYNISRRPGVDMYRRFSAFAFAGGQVRVDVKVKQDFTSYTVFPSAKNFKHDFKDGVISVYLDKPDYFGIQLDDDQNTIISIIADYPETEVPSKDDPNVIYIEGWYETKNGILNIDKDNTILYIAPGAVLDARIEMTASKCKVIGRGAILDPFGNLYEYDIREGGTEWLGYHPLNITKGTRSNVVDGVFFLDSRTHTLRTMGENHIIRNVKQFSTLITTDGLQIQSENSIAEHCYVYVGDNGLVVGSHYGNVFRDIAIGTTCAALFPEAKADDILFEDIYVFRSDDGIFNHFNISNGVEPTIDNIVVRRLSAMEMPEEMTHFFLGRSSGKMPKTFTFEDISIPSLKQTVLYENGGTYQYTDNYTLNFTNLAVGGEVIKNLSMLDVTNQAKAKNTETVTTSGSFTPVKRNIKVVNYKATDKVYAGSRQLFLSELKKEGGKLSFKTSEICEILRVPVIAGKDYVTAADLKSAKAITEYKEENGVLYLTPVYNGENILLPDEGELSHYTEVSAYQLDLIVSKDSKGYIYNICDYNGKTGTAGVSRPVLDELRMYGSGTYRITFSVRGSASATIKAGITSGDGTDTQIFNIDTSWKQVSMDINVSDIMLSKEKGLFIITQYGKIISEISFRDVTMVKIK